MGAGAFHVRVRDGIGCRVPAIATRSSNTPFVLCAFGGAHATLGMCIGSGVFLCMCKVFGLDCSVTHPRLSVDDHCAWKGL